MSTEPDYVSFDHRGRDELLSHIGSFTPHERSVFQRLCDTWAPSIDAQGFLAGARDSREQEQSALERLMGKLRAAQIGVLTIRESEGSRELGRVILTSRGSLIYWAAVVEEALSRLIQKGYPLLPSEARLRERKALPPDYHVVDAESVQLAASPPQSAEPTIYRLRLMGDFRVLFTPATARPLIERAMTNFRQDISERGILDELARVLDSSITELRQRLESKAPDVWLATTRTLIKERATIAYRKNLDERDEFFQLAYLIMVHADAQIGLAREQKKHEEVVATELQEIERAVQGANGNTLTREEFETLVEDAQSRLGPASAIFARRLTDDLLSPRPRRTLPRVHYVNGLYVHASHVHAQFERARLEMSERLARQYTELMEAFLKGRNVEVGEVFGSRELFRDDLLRRIKRQHPLLAELMERPQVIAEAVILSTKERHEASTPEDLREALGAYFDVDSSKLRPVEDLFRIDIVDIYDTAFATVGVFRQIVLRLGGRHESLRASYIRRFGPKAGPRTSTADDAPPSAPQARGRSATHDIPQDTGMRVRGTGNRGHRPQTLAKERLRSAPKPAAPRPKSREEIDKSWQEFDKALRKQPSEKDPS